MARIFTEGALHPSGRKVLRMPGMHTVAEAGLGRQVGALLL
jgi:hypothetical protein